MFKRRISVLAMLLLVCLLAYFSVPIKEMLVSSSLGYDQRQIIILDAGHGGYDGGAVAADGTLEKEMNLKIAILTSKFLKLEGFEVIMTRETDISTDNSTKENGSFVKRDDLEKRLKYMSDYPNSIFVSIHLNKFTTTAANGSQVFYSRDERSKKLSECIQSSIVTKLQPYNKRVNKQATSSTYLLYNATVPAVLVECGFLSNKAELERLKDTVYQQKMAFCISRGIIEYFKES